MPKLKTHKGAKRRFKVTASGKLLRMKGGRSHLRRKKAPRTKRLYGDMIPVHRSDLGRVAKLLPYGLK